jgi:predicted kinase
MNMNKDLHLLLDYENFNWEKLTDTFDFIKRMKVCPQDPIHHAEGNVWIHTEMVVKELLILFEENKHLTHWDKECLFAAAILHDVCKPDCTVIEKDGSITSKGHAKKGEYFVRNILFDLNFTQRERICKYVKYHGLPLWALEKEDPNRSVIESSVTSNNWYISILSEADAKGRKCNDLSDLLYRIELFRELCCDLHCYFQTKIFTSDHSRIKYFRDGGWPDTEHFNDTKFKVYLMVGLPGSGKDTWIKENLNISNIVSLDNIRTELKIKPTKEQGLVIQTAKERAKEFMRRKEDFVWNATNITKQSRKQLIDLFISYGGEITIVYLHKTLDTILSQNKKRDAIVFEKIIERMKSKLEVPDLTECHKLITIV